MKSSIHNQQKFKSILYVLLLLLYVAVGIIIGLKHEPWVDEAQAWLIARDNSIFEIPAAVRYEGTFALWHYILKLFIILGLDYNYLFVVPLLFSSIGVVLLLFYIDLSDVFKLLFLFSYYILYWNLVTARSYCLVFPLMMLFVMFYKERKTKPIRYFTVLFFLYLTSPFGVIMAGSFMLAELYEVYVIFKNKAFKDNFTYIKCFLIAGMIMIMGFVVLVPPDDVMFGLKTEEHSFLHHAQFLNTVVNTFLVPIKSKVAKAVITVSILAFLFWYFKGNRVKAGVYILPTLLFMGFKFAYNRHLTNLFILVLAVMVLFKPDFKRIKKIEKIIIVTVISIILSINSICAFQSIVFDYKKPYGSGKAVSEFLKDYVENENIKISAVGYYPIGVNAYYDKNIYFNRPGKSYYFWCENNNYSKISFDDTMNSDIIVSDERSVPIYKGYKEYIFDENIVFKIPNERATRNNIKMYVYVKE